MEEHTEYRKDGTIWAKGHKINGQAEGYWEWFRSDGTKLRSGHFTGGKPIGKWIIYDQKGEVHTVTVLKEK